MSKFFSKKDSEDSTPIKKESQLRVAKSAYRKILFKRIGSILGYSFISLFVLYLCFASTIMRAVPTTSGAGIVLVKENTYLGGEIPTGEVVLANTTQEQKNGYWDRLKQAFIPSSDAVLVEVIAGPYNSIKWIESGLVMVDGNLTLAHMPEKPVDEDNKDKTRLRDEYLAICISGACVPGEGVIFSSDNVYGLKL